MNGNWLLTASRDKKIKLFDVRTMKEMQTFVGHPHEVVSLAWHPIHEQLFCSGDYKGGLYFWMAGTESNVGSVVQARNKQKKCLGVPKPPMRQEKAHSVVQLSASTPSATRRPM